MNRFRAAIGSFRAGLNRWQAAITPHIDGIDNTGTGSLTLRLKSVRNARNYEVQKKSGTGGWESAGMFQSTRGMAVTGLTPGTNYTFQVRAIGGSTGQSDWSDPSGHMSL